MKTFLLTLAIGVTLLANAALAHDINRGDSANTASNSAVSVSMDIKRLNDQ